jgi:hypothetical protein
MTILISLLQMPNIATGAQNFDIKTIFATRETIFLDLFTFTQQQLQQLQQQTFK